MKKSIKNTLLGCACAACAAGTIMVISTTTVVGPDGNTTQNVVTNYFDAECPCEPITGTEPLRSPAIVLNLNDYTINEYDEFPVGANLKSDFIAFRKCNSGSFVMGSPTNELGRYSQTIPELDFEKQHQVYLTDFAIGIYEVTKSQYSKVMKTLPNNVFIHGSSGRAVDCVSWYDAQAFVDKVNERIAESAYRVDLPTDAQWEYACRAGTTTAFNHTNVVMDSNYRTASHLETIACYMNTNGLASNADEIKDNEHWYEEVGRLLPNNWGLYDMHGGVWEWCKDTWQINDYFKDLSITNPVHTAKSTPADPPVDPKDEFNLKVVRGGGYWFNSDDCRSANRHGYVPTHREHGFGFRIVINKK